MSHAAGPPPDAGCRHLARRAETMKAVLESFVEKPGEATLPPFRGLSHARDADDVVVLSDLVPSREICSSDPRVRTSGGCPRDCQVYLPDRKCLRLVAELVREDTEGVEVRVPVLHGNSAGEGRHHLFKWHGERMAVEMRKDLHLIH